jgi:glycosyltransferase involved in cell wall biosynthesis
MIHACTVVARDQLPYARVLGESFAQHHPDGRFTALILDADGEVAEPFDVLRPPEIGIPARELHTKAMIYERSVLARMMTPMLIRKLLEQARDPVMYFDPDIAIYGALDDVAALALDHSVVLAQRLTEPLPDDGCEPSEATILAGGVYDGGFLAVTGDAERFLDWWAARASGRRDSAEERWLDLVPFLFPHAVLNDPGCDVAYWNLHEREVRRHGRRYKVDGRPLRFFHFRGYRPDTPKILTHELPSRPRIQLSNSSALAALFDDYGRRLVRRGYGSDGVGYGFDRLPSGIPVDAAMRRLFRKSLLPTDGIPAPKPPDPFDAASAAEFLEWLREPHQDTSISRYAAAVYRSYASVRRLFPQVPGDDETAFADWLSTVGTRKLGVSAQLVHAVDRVEPPTVATGRAADPSPASPTSRKRRVRVAVAEDPEEGVNLVGYLTAELGLGEAARKLMAGLEAAQIPFSTITFGETKNRQAHAINERRAHEAPYDTNVVCVNADQLPAFRRKFGPDLFKRRYTIGLWFWELTTFPAVYHGAFDLVDEIWVATRFVRDVLARSSSKPIRIVPLPLEVPPAAPLERAKLGLPERFMFLFSFDFHSTFGRKNPLAVVDAFERAFGHESGPVLVIKCINEDADEESAELLRRAAASRSDIYLIEGYLPPSEKNSLMAGCDCYISLHRSEGLGLTMAEAMAYGKPVIATAYSGNLDFMHRGNSHLIPYTLVRSTRDWGPYPAGQEWANPDVDAAAAAMRHVYEDPVAARRLGEVARSDVLTQFSLGRTASFLADHLGSVAGRAARKRRLQLREQREALAALERRLSRGPQALLPVEPTAGVAVRAARGTLRRLLWQHLQGEHERQGSLVAAIAQLQEAVDALEERTTRLACDIGNLETTARDGQHEAPTTEPG